MEPSPEQWETVKALFHSARELEAANRSAFLRENCPDPNLRQEVERLLHESDEAGEFLSVPILFNSGPEPRSRLAVGDILTGRFKIVRFIAAGGMGEVYEAHDLELREHVALKTIRPEILSQPQVESRFKREVLSFAKTLYA